MAKHFSKKYEKIRDELLITLYLQSEINKSSVRMLILHPYITASTTSS